MALDHSIEGLIEYMGTDFQVLHCPICATEIYEEDWPGAHMLPFRNWPVFDLAPGVWAMPAKPFPLQFIVPEPDSKLVEDGITAVAMACSEDCAEAFKTDFARYQRDMFDQG